MIQNDTECPLEGFIKLGVSSHRDDPDKIGLFGSGLKMGVLTLLRNELYPTCYVGTGKLEYEVESAMMRDTPYENVFVKMSGRFGNRTINRKQELGFSLEYGSQDWTRVEYALREFISNAIDQSTVAGTTIEFKDNPRGKSGYTRIFIPCSLVVEEYIKNIDHHFLHFSRKDKNRIMRKNHEEESNLKVYRKGVFVTESYWKSLFNYNFGDEIQIDECRNMQNQSVSSAIGKLLKEDEMALRRVIEAAIEGVEAYETQYLSYWDIDSTYVKEVFEKVYPNKVVVKDEEQKKFVKNKGYDALVVKSERWNQTLVYSGVKTSSDVLNKLELDGCQITEPTEKMLSLSRLVWDKLECIGMTNNKTFPVIKGFNKPVEQGNLLLGFVDSDRIVYLNHDVVNQKTVLEELAHYITGATDGTKDFEDFIIRVASKLMDIDNG